MEQERVRKINHGSSNEQAETSVAYEITTTHADPKRLKTYEIPQNVAHHYFQSEGVFYDKKNKQAQFTDQGHSLSTKSEDQQTIIAMMDIARAKGWTEISLSGSHDFKKQAWLEANLQGMHTKGYDPTEKDRAELQALKKERSMDVIQAPTPKTDRQNLSHDGLVRLEVARKILSEITQDRPEHHDLMNRFDAQTKDMNEATIRAEFPEPKVRDLQFQPISSTQSERTR